MEEFRLVRYKPAVSNRYPVTPEHTTKELRVISVTNRLARSVWVTFIITFMLARTVAFLGGKDWFPDLRVQVGSTHVHHLNFGILILAAIGGYLLFIRPTGRGLESAAVLYGVGLALTFDEFGMWLHLEDVYWQRASFDAVGVIAGLLGLLVAGPTLRRFRRRHWATLAGLAVAVALFGVLVLKPLWASAWSR